MDLDTDTTIQQLRERIAQLPPAPDDARAAQRRRLLDAVREERAATPRRSRAGFGRRARGVLAMSGAATVAIVAAVALAPSDEVAPIASAQRVAHVAADRAVSAFGTGDWLYVRDRDDFEGSATTERWYSPDGRYEVVLDHWTPPASCATEPETCDVERVTVQVGDLETGAVFREDWIGDGFATRRPLEGELVTDPGAAAERDVRRELAAATTVADAREALERGIEELWCAQQGCSLLGGGPGTTTTQLPDGTTFEQDEAEQRAGHARGVLLRLATSIRPSEHLTEAIYLELAGLDGAVAGRGDDGDTTIRYRVSGRPDRYVPVVTFDPTSGMPVRWREHGFTTELERVGSARGALEGATTCAVAAAACRAARAALDDPARFLEVPTEDAAMGVPVEPAPAGDAVPAS